MSEQRYHYGRPVDGSDNRGIIIEEGMRVAFNLSGELAMGRVQRISEGTRYGKPHTNYFVELEHDAVGKSAGEVSKINNSRNLLAIREERIKGLTPAKDRV